jgi:inosine-uridine nucleoside N-ribohydrolase
MSKRKWFLAALVSLIWSLALVVQAAPAGKMPAEQKTPAGKIPVILDTDMVDWFDDGAAMVMLAKSPKIDLLGVTVVIGNTWVETGTASAIRQLEGIKRTDIPVACGVNQVTRKDRFANMQDEIKQFGHGADPQMGAAGYAEPASWQEAYRSSYKAEPSADPIKENAVDFLIRNIKARPHEITIVAIGSCANLAAALDKAPEIAPLVKRVVYMGGSYFKQGNVTPAAEFNFWIDPEAARKTLRAPFPEQLIFGLDVCEKTHFTKERFQELNRRVKNPIFQELIAHHWMTPLFGQGEPFINYIWDVLAAASVIDPTLITEERTYPVDVNDSFSMSYGQSLAFTGVGPEGSQKARIVFTVDENKLWQMIFKMADEL